MSAYYDVLIVGAGHGGAQAAIALRQLGFAGGIAIVGEEPDPPYERPPLSKDYLAGAKSFERLLIRAPAFWAERAVALQLGRRVVAVDRDRRQVECEDGRIGYGILVWAAGGTPRRLPQGGHVVRHRGDVDLIRAALPAAKRVVVVGGGYVGLEAAAVLRTLGKEVRLIEAQERLLPRVAAAPISAFYEAEHRACGVELAIGSTAIDSRSGDLLLVGIGIDPAVGPLKAAGAAGGNGVDVDEYCRTSLPGIYAIGDCAAQVSRFAAGARVRIESVQNAHDQANTAAKAIAGRPEPHDAMPWFWSNQYDLKLQTVGLHHGHDSLVLRGDPAARSFSLIYLRDGRVAALDCVNSVKDYAQGRRLVEQGAAPDRAKLADPAVPLKALC